MLSLTSGHTLINLIQPCQITTHVHSSNDTYLRQTAAAAAAADHMEELHTLDLPSGAPPNHSFGLPLDQLEHYKEAGLAVIQHNYGILNLYPLVEY